MSRKLIYAPEALTDLELLAAWLTQSGSEPCAGGWRALYEVDPDTENSDTAGDVIVLRVYGPGQSRKDFHRN